MQKKDLKMFLIKILCMLVTLNQTVKGSELIVVEQQQNEIENFSNSFKTDGTGLKLFKATHEWQEVNDEILPKGLHVRINLITGKKEAKLLESIDEKDKHSRVTSTYQVAHKIAKNTKTFLNQNELFLKKLNDLKKEAKENNQNIKNSFKTIEEIKKEFDNSKVEFKSESELLKGLFENYCNENDVEQKLVLLTDIEYYVHNIDLAKDLHSFGGFDTLISDLNVTSNSRLKIEILNVLGSSLQSNTFVKKELLKTELLRTVSVMINNEKDFQILKKCLFVISAFIRDFVPAQKNFFSKYRGIDIFETLLSHNFQLAIRATALVSDLLAETSSNSTNHNDLIQIINSSDICSKISNIFESDLDKYNLITLLESSTTILKSTNCRQYFQLNLLEKFQLKYFDDDFVLETVRTFAKQLPNHKEEL